MCAVCRCPKKCRQNRGHGSTAHYSVLPVTSPLYEPAVHRKSACRCCIEYFRLWSFPSSFSTEDFLSYGYNVLDQSREQMVRRRYKVMNQTHMVWRAFRQHVFQFSFFIFSSPALRRRGSSDIYSVTRFFTQILAKMLLCIPSQRKASNLLFVLAWCQRWLWIVEVYAFLYLQFPSDERPYKAYIMG